MRQNKGLATDARFNLERSRSLHPDGNAMNSHQTKNSEQTKNSNQPKVSNQPKPKTETGAKPAPQDREGHVMALDCPEGELSEPMRAYFAKCVEKIGFVRAHPGARVGS